MQAAIDQEAFRWASVAEATRIVMNIRYSLLTYIYTLFHYANTEAETVLRALAWEFPNDASVSPYTSGEKDDILTWDQLRGVDNQFMLGPSLLITPVLLPNVNTVQGIFPGVSEGTIWYDYYTLQALDVKAGENVTLAAPLTHINVHVRGGSILPKQVPGNTTSTTRNNPYELLVSLDSNGEATGSLYLDDGESLVQNATKLVQFSYAQNTLKASVTGSYHAAAPLTNITIAGVKSLPTGMNLTIAGQDCDTGVVSLVQGANVLTVTGLDAFTTKGAWEGDLNLAFTF